MPRKAAWLGTLGFSLPKVQMVMVRLLASGMLADGRDPLSVSKRRCWGLRAEETPKMLGSFPKELSTAHTAVVVCKHRKLGI